MMESKPSARWFDTYTMVKVSLQKRKNTKEEEKASRLTPMAVPTTSTAFQV